MVKGLQLLTILVKSSILDAWQGSEYASDSSCVTIASLAYYKAL